MAEVALVTGAAGNIGRATCACLARAGYSILATDMAPPTDGDGYEWHALDVTDTDSVAAAFQAATKIGTLKAVVNAHGILRLTEPGSTPADVMRSIIAVNLEGVANVLQVASTHVADDGAVVSISSIVANLGRAKGAFVYASTKAGLEALTRCFAVALGPKGIRVNAVAPGFLSEPMGGEGSNLRSHQGGDDPLIASTPIGRLVTPAQVAEVIGFLCSSAATGITGTVIPVDNGQAAL